MPNYSTKRKGAEKRADKEGGPEKEKGISGECNQKQEIDPLKFLHFSFLDCCIRSTHLLSDFAISSSRFFFSFLPCLACSSLSASFGGIKVPSRGAADLFSSELRRGGGGGSERERERERDREKRRQRGEKENAWE